MVVVVRGCKLSGGADQVMKVVMKVVGVLAVVDTVGVAIDAPKQSTVHPP